MVSALRPMEYALSLIMESGADEREAVQVFNVMGGYIMGFVMMETGQMFTAGALDPQHPDPAAAATTFPTAQLPSIAAALPHLATCDPDEQFEFGLDLLLSGLQAGTPARGSRRTVTTSPDRAHRRRGEDVQRFPEVLPGVVRRHDRADPGPPRATVGYTIAGANTPSSNSRRAKVCASPVARDHRRDGRLAVAGVEPELVQPLLEHRGVRPQALAAARARRG